MRVEGDAEDLRQELFPHGLVPQILQLLVDTWNTFQTPKYDEAEPKITNRFVLALQKEKRNRGGARFRILPHVIDVEGLDMETGKDFVEIDICIPHGYEERCYFGIEAKKLNATGPDGKWEGCNR